MIRILVCASLVLASASSMAQQRFIIERDIPGASKMSAEQLRDAARTSNKVLHDLGPDIQWVQSYVAGDKIYCVYNAPSESIIREHAQRSGFPANRITPVAAVIDPTTASGAKP
jgi:ERCC4-type nuclease